jgi:hypothetical protein
MPEGNFGSVQKNPSRRGAAVERVPQNREAMFRRVNADLMGPTRERLRTQRLP